MIKYIITFAVTTLVVIFIIDILRAKKTRQIVRNYEYFLDKTYREKNIELPIIVQRKQNENIVLYNRYANHLWCRLVGFKRVALYNVPMMQRFTTLNYTKKEVQKKSPTASQSN